MKTSLLKSIGAAIFLAVITNLNLAYAALSFHQEDFIVTAPSSTNFDGGVQNAFNFADSGFSVGYIPLYNGSDLRALDIPIIWQNHKTMWGPPSFQFLYGEPSNNGEHGQQLLRLVEINSDTPILVSDIWFDNSSSDNANSMHFAGNCATNANNLTNVLTFGTFLRGQYAFGGVTNSFVAGESLTNPVTKVILAFRVGWYVTSTSDIAFDRSYFGGHMNQPIQFATTAKFFTKTSSNTVDQSSSKTLSSHFQWSYPYWNGTNHVVPVVGQEGLGLIYHAFGTTNLIHDLADWHEVGSGPQGSAPNGGVVDTNTAYPQRFYYVTETVAPVSSKASFVGPEPEAPVFIGSNTW